jgi:integrase
VASIYRRREKGREDRAWVVSYKDSSGKWRKQYAETKEKAELLQSDLVRQSLQAAPPPALPLNISFKEYGDKWLERRKGDDLAARTIATDEWALETHLFPALGKMRLRAIHRGLIKDLLSKKRAGGPGKAGLAKDTVRLIRATLSGLFGDAVDDGLLLTNPVHGIRSRKLGRTRSQAERQQHIRPMSYQQLDTFLAIAETHCTPRDALYFLVMADTGLRPGEGSGLKWTDVDCANRELHVQRSITEDRQEKLTKTESARVVDLSTRLAAVLSARQAELEKDALVAGKDPSPWLFPSRTGKPLSWKVMSRLFREVRAKAGLPHFTLYDLRHTFATQLLTSGSDLLYVAHQLGHSKPTTTLAYYAHWMPRGDKKHLDRMMSARMAARTAKRDSFSPSFAPRAGTEATSA